MLFVLSGCAAATSNRLEPEDPAVAIASFCSTLLDGIEATVVTDGMSDAEVTLTMRTASRHYAAAAIAAPDEIAPRVAQIAENFDTLAAMMEAGTPPIQVLLAPPADFDQSATQDVNRYVDENCR